MKYHVSVVEPALAFASGRITASREAFLGWLRSTVGSPPEEAMLLRLAEFRDLHQAVTSAFDAAVAGERLPPASVTRLNEASALLPFAPRLELDGRDGATLVEDPPFRGRPVELLAAVARSAIRLLGSPEVRRLRRCPACGSYFLASRPDRVWCSPACGNRVRVARHHRRRRRSS